MTKFKTPKEYAEAVAVFCVDNSRSKEYLYPGLAAEVAEFVAEVLKYDTAVNAECIPNTVEVFRKAALKEAGDCLFFLCVPDVVLPTSDGLDIIHDPNSTRFWESRPPMVTRNAACLSLLDELSKFLSASAKEIREPETGELRWQQRLEAAGDMLRPLAVICHSLGHSLREVAEMNYAKLADRFARGVICGDGGNR